MSERRTYVKFLLLLFVFIYGCAVENIDKNKTEASKWAEKTMSGLSLEKKVAQMVCTDITGTYIPDDDPRLGSWMRLAGEYGVGGFVLYKGTPHNVANLLNRLQKGADIPLLISADFEGGAGQQVTGATEFPGNMGFAAAGDTVLMYEAARVMASEGRTLGIHLSYTPVTDLNISPDNPQESVRSFGGDINLMKKMIRAYVKGFGEMGMLNTAKHFPGRGGMKPFPGHPGFNYLDRTADELKNNEFAAFKNSVDAGVSFVMTEHIAVPSVTDGSELPASVEPALIKGVIRNKLGFKGIITTDDLWYNHVVERFGAEEVAVKAVEAGHDVVLKPKDPVATIKAITDAVRSGRISEERIDSSVYKILYYKALLGLHKNRYVDEEAIGKKVGTLANKEIISKVADKSITLLKNDGLLPLDNAEDKSIVNISVLKSANQAGVNDLEAKLSSAFKNIKNYKLDPESDPDCYKKIQNAVHDADLVILSLFIQRERYGDPAPVREPDLDFINSVIGWKPGAVIAMSYGNPYLLGKIGNVPVFLTGYGEGGWYGNQVIYFDSFINILKGNLHPTGKLPVYLSDERPIGYGLTF